MRTLLLALLLLHSAAAAARFACASDPGQVVCGPRGDVCFTVLTARVFRIQRKASDGRVPALDERCSFAITNRALPATAFTVSRNATAGSLTVSTSQLRLVFTGGSGNGSGNGTSADRQPPFTSTSLSITMLDTQTTWRYGDAASGNLGGTISSWNEVKPADMINGAVQPGVCQRGRETCVVCVCVCVCVCV